MNRIIFAFFTNKKVPLLNTRISIMRSYLRYKKWHNNFDSTPIEVVIPVIKRDILTLYPLVENIRKFLLHPIRMIYIIAPKNEGLEDFCQEYKCQFIDENTVLPITIDDIGEYRPNNLDRRGWLFQQLLKLGADSFVKTEHYYVLDSDTVLITPQALIKNDQIILNTSDEFHQPYRLAYEALIGEKPIFPLSFVAHQMVFKKEILKKLKIKIEQHTNKPWYQAIIELIDRNEVSSFSEYELYGNFFVKHHLHKINLEYFFNISVQKKYVERISEIEKNYQKEYKSVSFHWHGMGTNNLNIFST